MTRLTFEINGNHYNSYLEARKERGVIHQVYELIEEPLVAFPKRKDGSPIVGCSRSAYRPTVK